MFSTNFPVGKNFIEYLGKFRSNSLIFWTFEKLKMENFKFEKTLFENSKKIKFWVFPRIQDTKLQISHLLRVFHWKFKLSTLNRPSPHGIFVFLSW